MVAAFPTFIDQVVMQDGYSETPEINVAAFQPETGVTSLRRRSGIPQDIITCKMWLSSFDWEILRLFHRVTLLDGTQRFTWTHPRTLAAATFKFEGDAPKIVNIFGTTYEIAYTLRLISTT
jgi:hypothetical protein